MFKIDFCDNCGSSVKIEESNDFYKTFGKDIFIYRIKNKVNNYLFTEMNEEIFHEMFHSDILETYDIKKGTIWCGECIVLLRPFIFYIANKMIIVMPSYIDLHNLISLD